MPAISVGAALTLTFGLLWLTLWATPLRWAGGIFVFLGILLGFSGVRPDIIVARDGLSMAVRGADGRLSVAGQGASAFVVTQWLQADGDLRAVTDPSIRTGPLCNSSGCVARLPDGRPVTLTLRASDFRDDCAFASVMITPLHSQGSCKALVIDKALSDSLGSVEVSRNIKNGFDIFGARSALYNRPWSLMPRKLAQDEANPESDNEAIDEVIDSASPR